MLLCSPRSPVSITVSESFTMKVLRPGVYLVGFPEGSAGEEFACNAGDTGDAGFGHCVGKIPWRRKWQPTPVFLPEKSHGQKSLVGYNSKHCKESDMTEQLSPHIHTHMLSH